MTFKPENFQDACRAARMHALQCYPNESCGAILKDGEYIPFENVSPVPTCSFVCTDERAPYIIGEMVAAMVHSHPYKEGTQMQGVTCPQDFGPSKHDMIQQLSDDITWGIIATNGKVASDVVFWGNIEPVPLAGRLFRHGPSGSDGKGDCYALIKDFYSQELKIELPEGPRDYKWWHNDQNLYLDNMARAGFKTINKRDAAYGDIFFAQVGSKVPNHGGILLNNGLIFHHLANRVSVQEPIIRWRDSIVTWIRHEERS